MKKNILPGFSLFFYLLLCFAAVLMLSCPAPGNTEKVEEAEIPLVPPAGVTAARDGTNFIVVWPVVNTAEHYEVYRKQGTENFIKLTDNVGTEYRDTLYPKDKLVCYAVKSAADSGVSRLSGQSNILADWVQNVSATCLVYTNRIGIAWDIHPEAPDEYRVYRYLKKADGIADAVLTGITVNYFEDTYAAESNPIAGNQPYYYKVTWIKEGIEYGSDNPPVLGIYSSRSDVNEPNQDWEEAVTLGLNLAAGASVIYSFDDGAGNTACDTDWYHYAASAGNAFYVKVNLLPDPDANDFGAGELVFRFFYNNYYVGMGENVKPGSNQFLFEDYEGAAGAADVYFLVYPRVSSAKNAIDGYEIRVTDEM